MGRRHFSCAGLRAAGRRVKIGWSNLFPVEKGIMSLELRNRIYGELSQGTLIDPHTHINPLQPASETLADILGYHYYTELAHSAGMRRQEIEDPEIEPRTKVRRLVENLGPIDNTIQYSW